MERQHAPFSPSKLAMWAKCPNFVSADSTPKTERGVKIGELLQQAIVNRIPPEDSKLRNIYDQITMEVERLNLEVYSEYLIKTPSPNIWGWADLVALDPFGEIALLWEFKTGYGARSEPSQNPQILMYVWGLLEAGYETVTAFLVEIDQNQHLSATFTNNVKPLLELLAKLIAGQVGENSYPGDWCAICAKPTVCEAALEKLEITLQEAVKYPPDKQIIEEQLKLKSNEELAQFLDRYSEPFKIAEIIMGKTKEEAIKRLLNGDKLNGWVLERKLGPRQWEDEVGAYQWLLSEGLQPNQITQLLSPAQVEKLLTKEQKKLLSSFTKTTERKYLIREGKNGKN